MSMNNATLLPLHQSLLARLATKPLLLFGLAIAWGAWLAVFGMIPGLVRDASLISITFDLRDYLLRAFVVFLVAHLIVRQTSIPTLFAIPPFTFGIWQLIDVYAFSEWFSGAYRVNLHELNAQLFVVPVQLAVAIVGLVLCLRRASRTTSRIFATIMMWGSIVSTLMFHLAIVEVTYKPVEVVYSEMLKTASMAEDYDQACAVMKMRCSRTPIGLGGYDELWQLDPQLRLFEPELLRLVGNTYSWAEVHADGLVYAHLGAVRDSQIRMTSLAIPESLTGPMENYVFDEAQCPGNSRCYQGLDNISLESSSKLAGVLQAASEHDQFVHGWLEALPDIGTTTLWLRLLAKHNGELKLVSTQLPRDLIARLSSDLTAAQCSGPSCVATTIDQASMSGDLEPGLAELANKVQSGEVRPIYLSWVDKALSRNPVKYIDREEFLRSITYANGEIRITTTPNSFGKITLDMKVTFNLIITIFSATWLVMGVFLILFHTRRQLGAQRRGLAA
jgi:hypothetical protein